MRYTSKCNRVSRKIFFLIWTLFFTVMTFFPFYAYAIDVEVDTVVGIEPVSTPVSLFEGDAFTLKATLVYKSGKREAAKAQDVTWTTDATYLKVDENTDKVTFVKLLSVDGDQKEIKLQPEYIKPNGKRVGDETGDFVKEAVVIGKRKKVTDISFSPSSFSLAIGEEKPLTVTVKYNNGKSEKVSPADLDDPSKWTVDKGALNGAIQLKEGKVKALKFISPMPMPQPVTFKNSDSTVEAKLPIEIYAVDQIEISPEAVKLIEGQKTKLQAKFIYTNGKTAPAKDIVWKSEKPDNVSVAVDGTVTAVSAVESLASPVTPPAVRTAKAKVSAEYKYRKDPTDAGTETPVASNPSMVTVEEKIAVGLQASPPTLQLRTGEVKPFTLTLVESDGKKTAVPFGTSGLTITSNDTNVATVDPDTGKVEGKSAKLAGGIPAEQATTSITAAYKGKTVSIPVTVDDVKDIERTPSSLNLAEGQSAVVKANLVYTNGQKVAAGENIKWEYKNPAVDNEYVTFDDNGKVTGVKATPSIPLPAGTPAKIKVSYTYKNVSIPVLEREIVVNVKAPTPVTISKISLSPSSLTMLVKEAKALKVTATYTNGKTEIVQATAWKIKQEGDTDFRLLTDIPDSEKMISIDNDGTVIGLKKGKGLITAVYKSGAVEKTADIPVSFIVHDVEKIELSTPSINVIEGGTALVQGSLIYSNGKKVSLPQEAKWKSTAPNIAVVENGKVTGIAAGSTTVEVEHGLLKAVLNVTVSKKEMIGVTVSPASLSLVPGDSKSITLTALYSDGTKEQIPFNNWSTPGSVSPIAKIINGKVVAETSGMTQLTVGYNGKNVVVSVNVLLPEDASLVALEASPSSIVLFEGQSVQLKVSTLYSNGKKENVQGTVVYSTNSASVASVSPKGQVFAVSQGTANISITYEGKVVVVPVSVIKKSVTGLKAAPESLNLLVGEKKPIKVTLLSNDGKSEPAKDVTWISSDPAVASVNALGEITGIKKGVAFITVTDVTSNAKVVVPVSVDGISGIEITPLPLSLIEGQTGKLKGSLVYTNGKKVSLSEGIVWEIDPGTPALLKSAIALDDVTGEVTVKDIPEDVDVAEISIKAKLTEKVTEKYPLGTGVSLDDITGTGKIEISARKPVGLTFAPATMYLIVGESKPISLTAIFNDKTKADVTFDSKTSWNPIPLSGIIKLEDKDGKKWVTAESPGSAIIEAEYDDIVLEISGSGGNMGANKLIMPKIFKTAYEPSPYKEWFVQFNKELDSATVNKQTILVRDENNQMIDVEVELVSGKKVKVRKKDGYEPGKTYYLTIKRDVTSIDGKKLKENVRMPFVVGK